jgi:hypothetical protein
MLVTDPPQEYLFKLCPEFSHSLALEPTAAAPLFYGFEQIHACGFSRRGSALDR